MKVPSCDVHNLYKSKDDEFLMACLTPIVGNNTVAYQQTQTKVARAFRRGDGGLFNATFANRSAHRLVDAEGDSNPVLVATTDVPRLIIVLEHVARGLYWYVNKRRFTGTCNIIPAFLETPDKPELVAVKRALRTTIDAQKEKWRAFGKNKEVFQCHLRPTDSCGDCLMLMTFFENARVYVSFKPGDDYAAVVESKNV